MAVETKQIICLRENNWSFDEKQLPKTSDLIMLYGSRLSLEESKIPSQLSERYPATAITGCSTAGEIADVNVYDDSIIISFIKFSKTTVRIDSTPVISAEDSREAGANLAEKLLSDDLKHMFVISGGMNVNGSSVVEGVTSKLPQNIALTGGLAGDGEKFEHTTVVLGGEILTDTIVGVGLYGDSLKVGFGSLGGWDVFGPEREITSSTGNVLRELDGQSALALYKKYLGEYASQLPASGLLFPLAIRTENDDQQVVRTILTVDEETQSITFAGDVPEGSKAQLMRANFNRLIDGACGAAETSLSAIESFVPEFAVLISCVGRRMVLKQRVEEELEAVKDVLGDQVVLTGFYSYGEISPHTPTTKCELHNQTMTITAFSEE